MTAVPPPQADCTRADPRDAHWRATDSVAVLLGLLYVGWVAFGWRGSEQTGVIDSIPHVLVGLGVGALQWRMGAMRDNLRERLAWRLLAVASVTRMLAVASLGQMLARHFWQASLTFGTFTTPAWIIALTWIFQFSGITALLVFPAAAWRRADRPRFAIDAAIVTGGLVMWAVAANTYLSTPTEPLNDLSVVAGDALSVVFAAVLYLRSGSALTRDVAVALLAAHVLQLVPELWHASPAVASHAPAGIVSGIWCASWAIRWVSARWSLYLLATSPQSAAGDERGYRSGFLPTALVAAAPVGMLYALASPGRADDVVFLYSSVGLAILVVARQVVELQEHDRLLRKQEDEHHWFSAVLQHAYDVLALVDNEGRVVYASPATAQFLGAKSTDGASSFSDLLHPDDRTKFVAILQSPHFEPIERTVRMRASNGEWREAALRLRDLRHEPNVGAVVINGHDVSRELQMATQLRASRDVEALGVFAGGLAHDLNNFLMVIASHVELLINDLPAARREAHADLMAIGTAARRANVLTSGLLSLSRRKAVQREVVNIEQFLRERITRLGAAVDVTSGIDRLGVRSDVPSLRNALDAVLNDQVAQHGPLVPFVVSIDAVELGGAHAESLNLAAGPYVAVRIATSSAHTLEVTGPSTGNWENAPDDLSTVLVHAAVREAGGAIEAKSRANGSSVTLFLPSAAR